ncbi:MAG TPA: NAD-dependent epimerase/dehydratase family protein [Gemmatimonadales bacterium]|nr:NAD-dependent epimerase/dehydratase family protein [Gemmatimonadales bacterium]
MTFPTTESELEDALSTPTPGVLDTLRRHPGDFVVLGAGGKMGPSLSRMLKRGLEVIGSPARVIAVSRFSSRNLPAWLEQQGVQTHAADLLDPAAVRGLPDAHNVIYMAGQKFGTQGAPSTTWAMNAIVPALVAERYAGVRTVAFSTGNVYPLSPVDSGGPSEGDSVGPVGEYAMSCLARERVFEHFARSRGTPVALVRLNYAIDLRYGVLVDVARKIWTDEPVGLTMGYANVIWQGDANARSIQCLDIADSPATVINLTGAETVSIRYAAVRLGQLLGKHPRFEGSEAGDALLSDASRSFQLFGPLTVDTEQLLGWVAAWIRRGGRLLGKPTKFEARDGRF